MPWKSLIIGTVDHNRQGVGLAILGNLAVERPIPNLKFSCFG